MNLSKIPAALALAALFITNAFAQVSPVAAIVAPQGRLTIDPNFPVQTYAAEGAAAGGSSVIYYLPFTGNLIPISTSSSNVSFANFRMFNVTGTGVLTLNLNGTYNVDGSIYDIFVFIDSTGYPNIGTGPAWTSVAPGPASRNLAYQTYSGGMWGVIVNQSSITLQNSGSTYSVPALEATYVGSVYMTGNGETSMNLRPDYTASGGNRNVIGVFNAYNRVPAHAICRDSNTSWTYGTSSWRNADNSANNSITWLDGLGQLGVVKGSYSAPVRFGASGNNFTLGFIFINAGTVGTPSAPDIGANAVGVANDVQTMGTSESFYSPLGLSSFQAMEFANVGTQTIFGSYAMSLQWDGEI